MVPRGKMGNPLSLVSLLGIRESRGETRREEEIEGRRLALDLFPLYYDSMLAHL